MTTGAFVSGGRKIKTFVPPKGVIENIGMLNHSIGAAPRFVEYGDETVPAGS